ncbi:MAG: Calx-beta domain-containing protein [Panacagrimonas sp.]
MRMSYQQDQKPGLAVAAWAAGIALSFSAGSVVAADGDLVTAFGGGDGAVTQDIPNTIADSFYAAAVLADTTILAVGINPVPVGNPGAENNDELQIGRFTADGTLVSATRLADKTAGQITGVGVSPAGEIVVVSLPTANPAQPQVTKFDSTGATVLNSFAPPTTATSSLRCESKRVLFDAGKIVIGCQLFTDGNDIPVVVRLNSDLTPDTSFGELGLARGTNPNPGFGGSVSGKVVASDGAGGYYLLATSTDDVPGDDALASDIDELVFVQKFSSAGTLVPTYGAGGVAAIATSEATGSFQGEALFLDSSNRLVAGASRFLPIGSESAIVARLTPGGTFDSSFGTGGVITTPDVFVAAVFGDSSDRVYVLNSQGLVRLTANGGFDAGFPFGPSIIGTLYNPFEGLSRWAGAIVADSGTSALLLGGVDQFAVQVPQQPPQTSIAVATIAKIELGELATPAVARFNQSERAVGEGVGTITIGLRLEAAVASATTLTFRFGGAGASQADFTLPNGPTVVIPAGQTTGSLSLAVVNDARDEKVERLVITLNEATTNNVFDLTINDNDPEPSVSFDKATSFVAEGSQAAVLVRLSAPSGKLVSVPFTFAGTATQGVDYTFTPDTGTLFFNPGQTEKFILIPTVDGDADTRKESIIITLQDPATATLGAFPQRTVFINP